jgi:hypothetical protein
MPGIAAKRSAVELNGNQFEESLQAGVEAVQVEGHGADKGILIGDRIMPALGCGAPRFFHQSLLSANADEWRAAFSLCDRAQVGYGA